MPFGGGGAFAVVDDAAAADCGDLADCDDG